MAGALAIERPKRWDHPLDPSMLLRDLDWLIASEPFASMNPDCFPKATPLVDILKNDARISRYEHGDVIIREGEYGGSAFIVVRGRVRTLITRLESTSVEVAQRERPSWLKLLRDSLRRFPVPEVRHVAATRSHKDGPPRLVTQVRSVDDKPRVFLQDASAILAGSTSEPLGEGELFGEMAAITRSPSHYTVVAEGPVVLLEIRWQGLRLLRRDPEFQKQLDHRYRGAGLKAHLRETLLFRFLPAEHLEKIAEATQLVSYGDREWFSEYKSTRKLNIQEQLRQEPIIVEEGSPVNDLLLIRSGFARRSYRLGAGHHTIAYLGRGEAFGLSELIHNTHQGINDKTILPYQESLRAIGFVDVLKISRRAFVEYAIPFMRGSELPKPIVTARYDSQGPVLSEAPPLVSQQENVDPAFLEFLVDERLINGRQVMMIDTERCTRCDDCVRACARVHEGNPRFTRNGPQFGPFQFAHACMHCADPVCMIGCPTGAIARDSDTGIISINPDTCIGCSVCSESCPYENIVMVQIHDQRGRALVDKQSKLPILQATKCDLCHSLPTGPACQAACPHEALVRIDASNLKALQNWMDR
ncbi:MAG: cyclic nucleotide-binding domain-containing protein [Planctomycetota bacterium]|nr:cyclic nucleotide-binding domain-containing protein [Planctomycetota bacterium]